MCYNHIIIGDFMNKQKLMELRKENCGFNPEKAEDFYKVDPVDSKNNNILCVDRNDNHISEWFVTEAKNEIDFIESYPLRYGLVYQNKFYIQAE